MHEIISLLKEYPDQYQTEIASFIDEGMNTWSTKDSSEKWRSTMTVFSQAVFNYLVSPQNDRASIDNVTTQAMKLKQAHLPMYVLLSFLHRLQNSSVALIEKQAAKKKTTYIIDAFENLEVACCQQWEAQTQPAADNTPHALYKSLFEHLGQPVIILDADKQVEDLNQQAMEMIVLDNAGEQKSKHYTYTDFAHKHINDLLSWFPSDRLALTEDAPKTTLGEFAIQDHNENYYYEVFYSTMNVQGLLPDKYILVFREITLYKLYETVLLHSATHDSLTGLPNRKHLFTSMNHALDIAKRNNNPFALMFVDLNDFKQVNDTLGHEAGDNLLAAISNRLRSSLRESDTIGRFGGDEFIIILETLASPRDVYKVKQKLTNAMALPFSINDIPIKVSASIGTSVFPNDGNTLQELITYADDAMYEDKYKRKKVPRSRRGIFCEHSAYDKRLDTILPPHLEMIQNL